MTASVREELLALAESQRTLPRRMLSSLFPQQRAAIEDKARLKAFFCTRRAGKSWSLGVYFFLVALANPGTKGLYLGLTQGTTQNIMVQHIMGQISDHFGLGAQWYASRHQWVLPNTSTITFLGVDSDPRLIKKALGGKYKLACLDECSEYRQDVERMVYSDLLPAMGDELGTVVMSGVPSNVTAGLFYDVTTGQRKGWSVHSWSWRDNVHNRAKVQAQLDAILADNPAYALTPAYQQGYEGRWVIDTEARVYRARYDANAADRLPRPAGEWTYLLGIDFGHTDATALVVVAYHPHEPDLYIVECSEQKGNDVTDVADRVRALWSRRDMGGRGVYPFALMVADHGGGGKQIIAELMRRHHLPIENADKSGEKKAAIDAFNSDLRCGRIQILAGARSLFSEWDRLIWDQREREKLPPRWIEDPRFPNHQSDATLYAWRKARAFDAVAEVRSKEGDFADREEQERYERAIARNSRQRDYLDRPEWEEDLWR